MKQIVYKRFFSKTFTYIFIGPINLHIKYDIQQANIFINRALYLK